MLTITNVWRNERPKTDKQAHICILWFAAVDSQEQWWWLITNTSHDLGFTRAYLYKIEGRDTILHELEDDRFAGGSWIAADQAMAFEEVRRACAITPTAEWAQAYPEAFRRAQQDCERFWALVEGHGVVKEDGFFVSPESC